MFDVIYGILGSLNLISDVIMVAALLSRHDSGMKTKLRLFLLWNGISACAGFVTDIFFSNFFSAYTPLDKAELNGIPEVSARTTLYYICMVVFTGGFIAKCIVLSVICPLYASYDQIAAESVQGADLTSAAERDGFPAGHQMPQSAAGDRAASPSVFLPATPKKFYFGSRSQPASFQEQRYGTLPFRGMQPPPVDMPYYACGPDPVRPPSTTMGQARLAGGMAGEAAAAMYQPAQAAQLSYTPPLVAAPRLVSPTASAAPPRAASTPDSLSSLDASPESTGNQAAAAKVTPAAPGRQPPKGGGHS